MKEDKYLLEYRHNTEIDLSDTILNKYLNHQEILTSKIDQCGDPNEIKILQKETKDLEKQIDRKLDSYNLDAKYKNFSGPHSRKPISRENLGLEINNTIKKLNDNLENIGIRKTESSKPRKIEDRILKDNEKLRKISFTSTPIKPPRNINKRTTSFAPGVSPIRESKLTNKTLIPRLKTLLTSRNIKEEQVSEFFENPQNVQEISTLHDKGNNIYDIYNFVKGKLNFFKREEIAAPENVAQHSGNENIKTEHNFLHEQRNETNQSEFDHFLTKNLPASQGFINRNFSPINCTNAPSVAATRGDNNTFQDDLSDLDSAIFTSEASSEFIDIMASRRNMTTSVRGLSYGNMLELIPRFSGTNIDLNTFIDGIRECVLILGDEHETEIMRLARIKLFGEAKKCVDDQQFTTIAELNKFLETIFGSNKTYHELTGELSKIKQKSDEKMVEYTNRVKDLVKGIKRAATREDRIYEGFEDELEKDTYKYWLHGLLWHIRVRLGNPPTFKEAQDLAYETEREFQGNEITDDIRIRNPKETRKINYVQTLEDSPFCIFCQRIGHIFTNCRDLRSLRNQNANQNNYNDQRQPTPFQRNTSPMDSNNTGNFRNQQFNPNYRNRQDIQQGNFDNSNRNFNNQNRNYNRNFNDQNRNFDNRNRNFNGQNRNFDNQNRNFNGQTRYFENQNRDFSNRTENYNPNNHRPPPTPQSQCSYCKRVGHNRENCFKEQRDKNPQQSWASSRVHPNANSLPPTTQRANRETETGARSIPMSTNPAPGLPRSNAL